MTQARNSYDINLTNEPMTCWLNDTISTCVKGKKDNVNKFKHFINHTKEQLTIRE